MLVYLIHLDAHYKHARHYIGWAKGSAESRLKLHLAGNGSKFLRAVNAAGIGYHIARVWIGEDRNFERRMKNRKNSKHLCPVCNNKKIKNGKRKNNYGN